MLKDLSMKRAEGSPLTGDRPTGYSLSIFSESRADSGTVQGLTKISTHFRQTTHFRHTTHLKYNSSLLTVEHSSESHTFSKSVIKGALIRYFRQRLSQRNSPNPVCNIIMYISEVWAKQTCKYATT